MTKRVTPHRNIQFVWQQWHWSWKPYKELRRGRIDERICWRYITMRKHLASLSYLLFVPDLITLMVQRLLDFLFIVQHKRYL